MSEDSAVKSERAREALFERAPDVFAALAFLAGAITVIAIEMPSLPHLPGLDAFELLADELPDLSASIGGVVLMALATGLHRRLDAAWAATVALLGATALYAFFRHDHAPAATAAALMAVALGFCRPAFFRHSHLTDLVPATPIALGISAALAVGLVGGLLWAGKGAGFAEAPWWALLTDPHLGRPGRTLAAGAIAFVALVGWRLLLSRSKRAPAPPADADLARAAAMIDAAENARPDAELAFTGDKSFVFVEGAFAMAARGGGSLIAMGAPVGKRARWRDALIALRREGDALSLRPVVYSAPPELLPDLIDAGFNVEKIGENAIVDLGAFTLDGPSKRNLRTARRRFAEREGAVFDVLMPPHAETLWAELQPVSDAWLAAQQGTEKAFSLGRFDPGYLARQPIATMRLKGRIVAFANLWTTHERAHAALDLMRFDPEATPHGVMDFLITEILLWAKDAGYRDFDLGMAPLAGLAQDEYARAFARLGRMIYERAGALYGFQGLRQFKEKFGPAWEPRYLAAPGAWQMPVVLAEVALLTSGGVTGLLGVRQRV